MALRVADENAGNGRVEPTHKLRTLLKVRIIVDAGIQKAITPLKPITDTLSAADLQGGQKGIRANAG